MAADFFLGESLVGDGNEVAHIDLIIGSKSGPAGAGVLQRAVEQQGRLHHAARRRRAEPARRSPTRSCSTRSRSRAPSRRCRCSDPAQAAVARAVVDSVVGGRHPEGQGRRLLHPGRRVHPLGSEGRQEDLRLQLPGDQGIDRARARRDSRSVDEVISGAKTAKHPFGASGAEGPTGRGDHGVRGSSVSRRGRNRPALHPSITTDAQTSPATRQLPARRASSIASWPTTAAPTRS